LIAIIAVSLLAAALFGIAGSAAAARYFTECRGIPLSDLRFTSDCQDALSMMILGGGVLAVGVAAIALSLWRLRA
jgi:hypothetical protein